MSEEGREWRIERYLDENDPFRNPVWYVLEGNLVIAESEIQEVAERILRIYQERNRYEQALREIASSDDERGPHARTIAEHALHLDGEVA